MSNQNTFYAFSNLPTLYLPPDTQSQSGETVLLNPSPSPALPSGSAAILQLETSIQDSRPFLLRLHGNYRTTGTQSLAIQLYYIPGNLTSLGAATPGNNTAFFTSPPLNQLLTGSQAGNFTLTVECLWDSSSLTLGGVADGFINANGTVNRIGPIVSVSIPSVSVVRFAPSVYLTGQHFGSYVAVSEWSFEQV
jgi:hypothetical protein